MTATTPASHDACLERSVDAPPADVVNDLIRSHLPLVHHLVRNLIGRIPSHVRRDELVSAGMLALVTSAKSFDPERGVVFAHYAALRIRGALTDELRSMDWASRTVRAKAREVDAAIERLAATDGRTPTSQEVAAAMGVEVTQVNAIAAEVQRAAVVSLQALPGDGADRISDPGTDPESIMLGREQLGHLRDAVAELPERHRFVVQSYFYGQRTMQDIGTELGVTESRVSQIRSEALALMRDAMRSIDVGAPSTASNPTAAASAKEATRQAYVAAVAARSTLASRLEASAVFGQSAAATTRDPLAVAN